VLNHSGSPEKENGGGSVGAGDGAKVRGSSGAKKQEGRGGAAAKEGIKEPIAGEGDGMIRRTVCLRLAELELLLGKPGDALTALAAAPAAEADRDHENRLRTVAMIAAGQMEGIPEGTTNLDDASVWLEALETVDRMEAGNPTRESVRQALRQKIAKKARELGDATLSEEDRSRITAVLGEGDGGKSPPPSASAGGDDGG